MAREHSYEMFLCNSVEERVLRAPEDKRVDGTIICSSRLPQERLFRRGESEVLLEPELIVRESAPRIYDPSRTNRGGEDR